MTDDDIANRIAARAAEEQGFSERQDRVAAGIQILVRAFVDLRAVGLDNSAIARLLRHAIAELEKHPIEEFEE